MKLILGTAQFGLSYGTFNATGQVSLDNVVAMLSTARSAGIDMLDTARSYGISEEILARTGVLEQFDVVTKCPDLSTAIDPLKTLHTALDASCAALGVTRLYGYLLHNAEDLWRPGIWEALCSLRDSGRVKRIGVSGYDIETVADLCDRFELTLVQLPANVLDPWFENVTFPEGVEVHARSAFLQGFLLSNPERLPRHLEQFRTVLEQFRAEAAEQELTPLQAALLPLLASPSIMKVVIGADSPSQLDQIIEAVVSMDDHTAPQLGSFAGVTRDLTDPRRWRSS